MTRSLRRLTAVSAAAIAAVAVAGCGTPQAGSAAVIGERRIPVSDVQEAYRDVNVLTGADAQLSQTDILNWLILAPFVSEAATAQNVGVSENDAALQFAEVQDRLPNPSPAALEVVRTAVALSRLQGGEVPAAQVESVFQGIIEDLRGEEVDINPRYGEGYDLNRLVVRTGQSNWLKPSATPSAQVPVPDDGTGQQPPADDGTGQQPPADDGTGQQPPADDGTGQQAPNTESGQTGPDDGTDQEAPEDGTAPAP